MCRLSFHFLILLLLSSTAYTQTASTDSQTLQSLLAEVRQLRQDLKTTTVATERAQILIYRVQVKQVAVEQALRRLDIARSKLAMTQSNRQELAAHIKTIEDSQASANSALEQKEMTDMLTQLKAKLELSLPEVQERQTNVSDCEDQVRLEQAKLNELQDQLEQLDMTLKNASAR